MSQSKISPVAAADGLGPVPEANRPGHHPEVEQDKPAGVPPGPVGPSLPERFVFAFEPLLRPFAMAASVWPGSAHVTVGDQVTIRFGLWPMAFSREQVTTVEETGSYQFVKVAGPPRLSLADGGITFATNRQRGLCIQLADPQPGPYPWLRHPSVTVTVADPDGLAEALTHGPDGRRR